MSLEVFQIVDVNPNDRIGGGGCLCSPGQKVASCQGPYVTFPNAEVAGDPNAGYHNSPNAVASVACIQAAAKASGGEVLSTAPNTGRGDEPDLDWHEDITEEQQIALQEQFPKGGLTKLLSGKRVFVPPAGVSPTIEPPLGQHFPTSSPDVVAEGSLDDLLGDTDTPKLEEPGTKPFETVPATPEFVDEPKDAPLDESGPELEL